MVASLQSDRQFLEQTARWLGEEGSGLAEALPRVYDELRELARSYLRGCCPCQEGMVRDCMRSSVMDGMDLARRGAVLLYRNGAEKVWVFGSVAKGRRLDFRSDIDFAVKGMAPEKILRLGAELEELLTFAVDLVEIEKARPALRAQIEGHGIFIPREN